MAFTPFTRADFQAMQGVTPSSPSSDLETKITELRRALGRYPELNLDFFRTRIVRRPTMRGKQGLVFGPPKWYQKHWCSYVVGGDQDQVQLNIGMFPSYLRVGLGFMIGRQVTPKIPAFQVLQTFLGVRPPLPFRDAFLQVVKRNDFQIEGEKRLTPQEVISRLETHVIPADEEPQFVFVGALWSPDETTKKTADDYRKVFLELLPFYEELILAGGRYFFFPD